MCNTESKCGKCVQWIACSPSAMLHHHKSMGRCEDHCVSGAKGHADEGGQALPVHRQAGSGGTHQGCTGGARGHEHQGGWALPARRRGGARDVTTDVVRV